MQVVQDHSMYTTCIYLIFYKIFLIIYITNKCYLSSIMTHFIKYYKIYVYIKTYLILNICT